MQRLFPTLLVVLFLVVSPLHAEPKVYGEQRIHRWWDAVTDDIAQTWEQPDRYDLYLPFLSWHARFMYDKEKTDNYNEMPWGWGPLRGSRHATTLPTMSRCRLSSRFSLPDISASPSSSPISPEPTTTATCCLPGCAWAFRG